ncbi:DegV family EDD domain-containing protein, partial [bacterium]|nr:DegV family EDD domain-containing protein [bacterium]
MALTMQSIAEGAISCRDSSISGMSQCLADAALMGARGNSGAILAQFFQGLAESFKGRISASLKHFGEAVDRARHCAFEAISEPQDGTILTVIHDWAERIKKHCHIAHDFLDLLKEGMHEAQKSLKETPRKLKLLAKAGVVDAGAQGFVHLLEGVLHFMESGKIEKTIGIGGRKRVARAKTKNAPQDITYQYCTECLVTGNSIDRSRLREELSHLGNSLIVAGSTEKVRVHIHTDEPQTVFERVSRHGSVTDQKHEDMRKQHSRAYGDDLPVPKIALVTDSSCDLPPQFIIKHNIQMVPIQIAFGSTNYLDKINITPKEFYRILQESDDYPKTSQPTPGEFLNTYDQLWGHFEAAVSIHVSGALSGTLSAARTAARSCRDRAIRVLDSRNSSVGMGLVVAEAAKAIEEGCDFDEVVKRTEWAIDNVRFIVCFETVEYLIRGGRLGRSRGLIARLLNLKPIIALDREGKVENLKKAFGGSALKKTMDLVCKEAVGKRNLRFAVAHANALEKADWLAGQIQKQFEVRNVDIVNVSPALGAHSGPGAAGVAFLGGMD